MERSGENFQMLDPARRSAGGQRKGGESIKLTLGFKVLDSGIGSHTPTILKEDEADLNAPRIPPSHLRDYRLRPQRLSRKASLI